MATKTENILKTHTRAFKGKPYRMMTIQFQEGEECYHPPADIAVYKELTLEELTELVYHMKDQTVIGIENTTKEILGKAVDASQMNMQNALSEYYVMATQEIYENITFMVKFDPNG